MFTKTHRLLVGVPIPPSLPPDAVVQALHQPKNLLELQPMMDSYNPIPTESLPEKIRNDTDHFAQHLSRSPITAFDIAEKIQMIPGVNSAWAIKIVRFPGRFQNLPNGVRVSASAPAGVTTRGEYRVEFRDGSEVQHGDKEAESGWWLVEETSVECSAFLMPLVGWNLDTSHKGMLEQLLDKIQREQGGGNWDKPPAPPPKD
jgi:hypothetical protein